MKNRILFIGGGNMGEAIIKGLRSSPEFCSLTIFVSEPEASRLEFLKNTYNIIPADESNRCFGESDTIIIAVKPDVVKVVLAGVSPLLSDKLVVSIAAGVTISDIQGQLAESSRVVRVMPNTPALVSRGVSALSFSDSVPGADRTFVLSVFNAVGKTVVVPEKLMDAVTGLSGSGPAFVFLVIESLSDAGVKMGLPRETALLLAAQTVKGAAEMVLQTGKHPAALKDMVTSPGGTTISGVHVLEKGRVRASFIDAVEAAAIKSRELRNSQEAVREL